MCGWTGVYFSGLQIYEWVSFSHHVPVDRRGDTLGHGGGGGGRGGVTSIIKVYIQMCGWNGVNFQASKYMNGYHFHIKNISMGYLFHQKSVQMYEWVKFDN